MEYVRQRGLIQADLARRAGNLLVQYPRLIRSRPSEEKYDATLTLCVLQALLVNCRQLYLYLGEQDPSLFELVRPRLEQLTLGCVKTYTFPDDPPTIERVLEHLRDAVSHPTVAKDPRYPPTGYTTTPDPSGEVTAFRFTSSPWVEDGELISRGTTEKELRGFVKHWERQRSLPGFLDVRPDPDGKLAIVRIGDESGPYLPLFVIELPLPVMVDIGMELANFLTHPTADIWSGTRLLRLVALG